MNPSFRALLWRQFGAAIDMLENAVRACPKNIWGYRVNPHEFWYLAYHTLFWLDFYLEDSEEKFAPPAPFDLGELDPAGVYPERVYTPTELLSYLAHGRQKAQLKIGALTDESAAHISHLNMSALEVVLYNMRHVQHHTAQLNLLLRQSVNSAPRWVRATT